MDRRTLIAVTLCLGVYYVWYLWLFPTAEPTIDPVVEGPVASGSPATAGPAPVLGAPVAPVVVAPARELAMRQCETQGTLTTQGGGLRKLSLDKYPAAIDVKPLYSWLLGLPMGTSSWPWAPYGGQEAPVTVLSEDAQVIRAGRGALDGSALSFTVLGESPTETSLEARKGDGLVVTQKVTPATTAGGACVSNYAVTWRNEGTTPLEGPLWVGVHDRLGSEAGGFLGVQGNPRYPSVQVDGTVTSWPSYSGIDDEGPHLYAGKVDWFGIHDRYFGVFVLPAPNSAASVYFSSYGLRGEGRDVEDRAYGEHLVIDKALAPGESHTEELRVFSGPLDRDVLAVVDPGLTSAVEYGWFSLFAVPLLWYMKLLHAGFPNWGVAIILLTFTMKVVFFPLTQASFQSSTAMQALQPQVNELRARLADNPEEMNRQMMALFKDNGVNPVGGCLPMVLQMPVWFALYRVLMNGVELYHSGFLYIRDLSAPDPYGISPFLVMGLMYGQQKMTPTTGLDPAQARVLQFMPLIFGMFMFNLPSGLVLYTMVNMSLSMAQQWFIRRTYKLPAPKVAPAA